jgi:hypothetical protein
MLPGLLLKNERLVSLAGKPLIDYFIPGCCFQSCKHIANIISSYYFNVYVIAGYEISKSTKALQFPKNNVILAFS